MTKIKTTRTRSDKLNELELIGSIERAILTNMMCIATLGTPFKQIITMHNDIKSFNSTCWSLISNKLRVMHEEDPSDPIRNISILEKQLKEQFQDLLEKLESMDIKKND